MGQDLRPEQPAGQGFLCADPDQPGGGMGRQRVSGAAGTLIIDEQEGRRGIGKSIGKLLGGPPRVEAYRGDPAGEARPVDQQPFRVVAHRNAHPVVLGHPLRGEPAGHAVDHVMGLRISDPFVLENQVGIAAESARF